MKLKYYFWSGLWFCVFFHPRRGDQGSDRDEREDHRGKAPLRGACTEERGQESSSGQSVHTEDGRHAGPGHAADARGATDGDGRVPYASRRAPASECSKVLCPCSTSCTPAEVATATAEHGETLWRRLGHGWINHGHGSKYGGYDARHDDAKGWTSS